MKVQVTYYDNDAFTVEEVVKQAIHNYGHGCEISVNPESSMAYDHIYFGIQQLITHEQISLIYEKASNYQQDIQKLRDKVLFKVQEIVDQVIVDNEAKVG